MNIWNILRLKKQVRLPDGWGFAAVALVFVFTFTMVLKQVFADDPVSSVWDFSDTSVYINSNPGSVELISGSARLKVLEYSADSSAMAIFHMNETSGSAVEDSSLYALSGSGKGITWTTSGKLNGAVNFSGTSPLPRRLLRSRLRIRGLLTRVVATYSMIQERFLIS